MRPLQDMILIRPDDWVEIKQGSIVLPDTTEMKKNFGRGTVLAVGPGVYTQAAVQLPPEISVGDRVLYYKQYEVPIVHGKQEIVLISEKHLLAVFEAGDFEGEN